MKAYLAPWSPQLLSILRIVTGFMFMQHGTQKWLGFPIPRQGPIELWSTTGIAGALELVGGALMHRRPVHAPDRVHPLRLDGVRVFPRACAAGLLDDRQPGRIGCAL